MREVQKLCSAWVLSGEELVRCVKFCVTGPYTVEDGWRVVGVAEGGDRVTVFCCDSREEALRLLHKVALVIRAESRCPVLMVGSEGSKF